MELKAGYKQTEVGPIPQDWNITTASAACDVVVDCKNRTPPVVPDSDFCVVRTPNVRNGQFVLEDLRCTDEASYHVWTARAVPRAGDVMITREAPLGEVCAVPPDRKVCLGQRMMLYRPSAAKTDPTYLLYALQSTVVRENLARKVGGSTVGHAKVDDIRFLTLPLPPLPEQRAIAAALSDVDALIGSLDRLIAKKRDLKQAAMQQLLTGQTRLPGFSGEWETKRLGEIARFRTGPFGSALHKSDYATDGIPLINPMHIVDGNLQPDRQVTVTDAAAKHLADFLLREGDIVIGRRGDMGRCAVVRSLHDGWLCGTGIADRSAQRWRIGRLCSATALSAACRGFND